MSLQTTRKIAQIIASSHGCSIRCRNLNPKQQHLRQIIPLQQQTCRSLATTAIVATTTLPFTTTTTTSFRMDWMMKQSYYNNNNYCRSFSSYPNHQVVGLPSLSPTMESGTIASWNVAVGDKFGPGDSLCSIETDKATVDFEAQDDGVVAAILVPAGSGMEIKIGSPILVTVEDTADVSAFANFTLENTVAAAAPATPTTSSPPPPASSTPPSPAKSVPSTGNTTQGGRVTASPLAHMMAKELGYNINDITGTGPDGRIIAADIKEFVPSSMFGSVPPASQTLGTSTDVVVPSSAAAPAASGSVASTPPSKQQPPMVGAGYTDYPLSESAKEVAQRLMQSKRNVPHYYLTVDICLDEVLKLRTLLNTKKDGTEIGMYELFIKAAALSMKTVPSVNASWMESVVRVYDSVDINVVLGSGDTLSTPILRNCSTKGLQAISNELNDASTSPTSTDVGTFTMVNLGMYGIKSCAPIIREPQSCALAIGVIENRIVPRTTVAIDDDELYQQSVMVTVTIACDHRVVDGAVGAQWLSTFKSHLENPTTMLL